MTQLPRIPDMAWKRRLDDVPERPGRPSRPPVTEIIKLVPLMLRLYANAREHRARGHEPMDWFTPPSPGPIQGVPLGGIGGGSITRGWRGDWCRWQLRPGPVQHGTVWADQFAVRVQRPHGPPRVQVLHPGRPPWRRLSAWAWNMPAQCATYYALFPRAWTVYDEPVPGIRLTCRQISPVIPHNYRDSSFPVAVFVWTVENLAEEPAEVSLLFCLQNGNGGKNDGAGGHVNRSLALATPTGEIVGVTLQHRARQPRPVVSSIQGEDRLANCPLDLLDTAPPGWGQPPFQDPLTFAIAAQSQLGQELTSKSHFLTCGDGAEVWKDWTSDGRLTASDVTALSPPGHTIGAAVAVSAHLQPRGSCTMVFAASWDAPLVRFGDGRAYRRRYTRFFGDKGDAAPALLTEALARYSSWEQEIEAWQNPILSDPNLPEDYKAALFNELYYVVDGGSVWTDGEADSPTLDSQDMGHFAYLEGLEYPMYNTYDVHFYASFALVQLWPLLELSLQRDIARAVPVEHPALIRMLASGRLAARKVRGSVPHDLGLPNEDPWYRVNGYRLQDVSRWKDLNSKFVLQVYRDWLATRDSTFLADVWPAVREAVDYAAQFDRDGDGIIDNEGFPDQTYDMWPAAGASAYSGGLWLAALGAAAAIAQVLGESALASQYRGCQRTGLSSYTEKLWKGRYLQYDSSAAGHHDSIMADQMAGQWYARSCGLPDLLPWERVVSSLRVVLDNNVRGFGGGCMGAVNGMRPHGRVDTGNMQSQEVWTGTTYALAANMICHGLLGEAFETARGIYASAYGHLGYWFQTPEAWDRRGNYRSLAYMRPLAIWAMQWAWERCRPLTGQAAAL